MLTVQPRPSVRVSKAAIVAAGLTLSTHMDATGGSCFPGLPLLSAETGLEASTVTKALAELRVAGMLEVKRTGRSNRYQALIPVATPGENPVESVEKPGDKARENGSNPESESAGDRFGVGEIPTEDVQEGVDLGLEVQDLLLLGVENDQERETVRATIEASLGAAA